MDLNYSAEETGVPRRSARLAGRQHPAELRDKMLNYEELSKDDLAALAQDPGQEGLGRAGLARSSGAAPAGTSVQRYIFEEECGLAGAPPLAPFGLTMCALGAAALRHRRAEEALPAAHLQRRRLLVPGLLRAGLGLGPRVAEDARRAAAATTTSSTARRSGPRWATTPTGSSAWCAPTPSAAKRQEGITFLLIDMKTPGITVRPLILMDGGHEVNEVFFDDVKVPVENLVHEENKGWTVAKYLLGHERLGTGRIGGSKRELAKLKALAAQTLDNGKPLIEDPRFRDRLSRVEIELMALEITNLRFLDEDAPHRPAAGRRGLDAQDQGHRDPAGAHRADDAGRRSAGAGLQGGRRRRLRRLRRVARAALLQLPQDHRSTPGPTRSSATSSPRWRWACKRETTMNFQLSEEQQLLADSVRSGWSRRTTTSRRGRRSSRPPRGTAPRSGRRSPRWACSALPLSADHGGFGGGAVDLVDVMEAIGDRTGGRALRLHRRHGDA